MGNMPSLLKLDNIRARYGESQVLNGVSLEVCTGESVSLLGRNGMGKSTTIKAIMGMLRISGGSIYFDGQDVSFLSPHRLARLGLGYVPEERRIFPSLTVLENLEIVAGIGGPNPWPPKKVFALFPVLEQRKKASGKSLSGGEQQMLAMARVLRQGGIFLLLDEPTEGLAPIIVNVIHDVILELKNAGLTILLVEQNLHFTMSVVNRHFILSKGKIVYEGSSDDLRINKDLQKEYLAV